MKIVILIFVIRLLFSPSILLTEQKAGIMCFLSVSPLCCYSGNAEEDASSLTI